MDIYEVRDAVRQARATIDSADSQVAIMMKLCSGRLQQACKDNYVPANVLCALKRELQNYDMRTGQWKDPK